MATEFNIQTSGFKIAAKSYGPENAPTILALHGWLDNANSFDFLVKYLDEYKIIALDLPGHGKSSHLPQGAHYHFIDAVILIFEIADILELDTFSMIGHSMGGGIAPLVAGTFPERIEKLILIEGLGALSEIAEKSAEQLHRYIEFINPVVNKKTKRYYKSFDDAVAMRAKNGYLSLKATRQLCLRGLDKSEQGYYFTHDRRLTKPSPLRLTEEQVINFFENIKAPTCLITAKDGFKFDPEKSKNRTGAIQNLSHHIVDGGHHVHMENPQEVAQIIRKFL